MSHLAAVGQGMTYFREVCSLLFYISPSWRVLAHKP